MIAYREWRTEWDDRGPWQLTPREVRMLLDEIDRRLLPPEPVDTYDPDDREPMGGDHWWKDEPEW